MVSVVATWKSLPNTVLPITNNSECVVHLVLTIKKGKVFPYSLPSVGPGADPGVQAVSLQVT